MSSSGGQQDRLQKHGPEQRAPVDLNKMNNTGWSMKKQGLYGIATSQSGAIPIILSGDREQPAHGAHIFSRNHALLS